MEVADSAWALVVLLLSKRSMRTKDVLQNLSMPRAKVLFSGSTTAHDKNSFYQHFLLQICQGRGERRYQKTYTRDKMSNRRCDRLVRQPSITDSSSGESIDSEGSDDVESGRGDDSIHTSDEEFIEPDTSTV
jgi:hypothetical protein